MGQNDNMDFTEEDVIDNESLPNYLYGTVKVFCPRCGSVYEEPVCEETFKPHLLPCEKCMATIKVRVPHQPMFTSDPETKRNFEALRSKIKRDYDKSLASS